MILELFELCRLRLVQVFKLAFEFLDYISKSIALCGETGGFIARDIWQGWIVSTPLT